MFAKPSAEHGFFTPMIGQWTMENHCEGESGQTKVIATGRVSIRSLAGMWFIIETSGDGNEHHPEPWSSQITVGYDPQKKAYVGIFVGSMMTHLWIYEGQRDESKPCVSLYVEGPRCEGTGMAQYRDSIEIVSDDHWILRSEIQNDDGSWKQFMIGHHHRVK